MVLGLDDGAVGGEGGGGEQKLQQIIWSYGMDGWKGNAVISPVW